MKKQPRPSAFKFSVLRQLCNLIPFHLVPRLARESGVDEVCPALMRRVRALVGIEGIEGIEREMEFLTNNMDWSPRSVADLYRSRWDIEVFFKQIKQTLKLADFLGHSANAVRWQFWSALLCYLLLRFQAYLSGLSFGLGQRLHPDFYPDLLRALAKARLACSLEKLWDIEA